jgi:hypothetical protein
MGEPRSWHEMRDWCAELLLRRSGDTVETWNSRIRAHGFADEASLRQWLAEHGVTGYAQMLLVMETFGYPDFFSASADQLIDGQYADRPQLRPILDALLAIAPALGDVTVQARKTYVSLVSPRRQFAVVKPTTRKRVDLGLRLDHEPVGRLEPAKGVGNDSITVRIGLSSSDDVDDDVVSWLQRTYAANV